MCLCACLCVNWGHVSALSIAAAHKAHTATLSHRRGDDCNQARLILIVFCHIKSSLFGFSSKYETVLMRNSEWEIFSVAVRVQAPALTHAMTFSLSLFIYPV